MKRNEAVKMEGLNMTEQELDRKLNSDAQLQLRQAVRAMPEDSVSMAWRSELNQKLVANVEAKQRKRRFTWFLSPALGLGVAGALAVVVMTKTPHMPNVSDITPKAEPSLEQSLVASHQDEWQYMDVTGVGLSPEEVVNKRSTPVSYDYSEVDLGSL